MRVEEQGSSRRLANVVLPTMLTASAFAALNRFGLVGNWPLWALLTALFGGAVVSELAERGLRPDAGPLRRHLAVLGQVTGVTVIIYAIGWGPTLAIGSP